MNNYYPKHLKINSWPFWYFPFSILVFLCSSIGVGFLNKVLPSQGRLLIQLSGFLVLSILVVFLLNRVRKQPTYADDFGFVLHNPYRILWIVGVGYLSLHFATKLGELLSPSVNALSNAPIDIQTIGTSAVEQWLFIVSGTIFAPLGEEMVFRILMFGSIHHGLQKIEWLRKRIPPHFIFAFALCISSYFFTVAHQTETSTMSILLMYFCMASIFALSYAYSGSLWAPVFVHCINNVVALLGSIEPVKEQIKNIPLIYGTALLSPFVCALLLWLLSNAIPRKDTTS